MLDGAKITDESMVVQFADEIVELRMQENKPVRWPGAKTLVDAESKEDYPQDIWAEAERKWNQLTPDERDKKKQELDDLRKQAVDEFAAGLQGRAFEESFGPWDLLWAALAVVTAYKIGAGSYSTE